ncbi:CDP-glycerol glycerophosphotransferase family protein [Sporosarcina sp. FSL K6-3457]|uniref:CDP-glycerol glycerophosphotransferase family protein n=1 Tax=Sporosarcina sp. FSL K6-3457 TaxID=2978204 RepID=UPI0030FB30B9
MKEFFTKYIKVFCSFFPIRNVILFESVPDMDGNSRAVFDTMVKLNFHEKYRLVWLVDNKVTYNNYEIENIYFDYKPTSLFKKIMYVLKYFNVKVKISENACYPKFHRRTVAIHLGHGTAIKNTGSLMHINGSADYALYQSEAVKEITAELHNLNEDQLVCLGYPRNDNLIKGSRTAVDENYIVWLPTFRKSNLSNRLDSDYDFPLGIPILKDLSEVRHLNSILKRNNFKLYIKPHFVARLNEWDVVDFSHVKLITEDYYKNQGLLLYEFLGMSKALITDYSSVYFDYLLMDKPIGVTVDDLQQYEKGLGFVYDDFKGTILGELIDSYEDLEKYIISCIENNIDIRYLRARKEMFNKFTDDQSSIRVVDFLKERADL